MSAPAATKPRQSVAAKLAAAEAELERVTLERNVALWLYRELEHKVRSAIIKQMVSDPGIQEQLAQQALAKLSAKSS